MSSILGESRKSYEKKERLTKAIINIIKKLKTSTGLKREKYMKMVCNEFNLDKNEKWVITKLRMMLVRLDAGFELLQIRTAHHHKTKREWPIVKEASPKHITKRSSIKYANEVYQRGLEMGLKNMKVKPSKQVKAVRKPRKSLECRQLEKLRMMKFDNEQSLRNSDDKVSFLNSLKLQPRVFCF